MSGKDKINPINGKSCQGNKVTDILTWRFDSQAEALWFISGLRGRSFYSFLSLDKDNVVKVEHTYYLS